MWPLKENMLLWVQLIWNIVWVTTLSYESPHFLRCCDRQQMWWEFSMCIVWLLHSHVNATLRRDVVPFFHVLARFTAGASRKLFRKKKEQHVTEMCKSASSEHFMISCGPVALFESRLEPCNTGIGSTSQLYTHTALKVNLTMTSSLIKVHELWF